MTIETASSPEDLAALALVFERLHGRRVGVAELVHDLAVDPDTRFFLARHEREVVGSGVAKRSSLQGTSYAIARVLPEARRQGAGSALYEALSGSSSSGAVSSTPRACGSLSAVASRSSGARSSPS